MNIRVYVQYNESYKIITLLVKKELYVKNKYK